MILKSAYNELYTKQVLNFFWENYIQNGDSKTIIYAKDIYKTLGYEMTAQEEYTKNTPSEDFFLGLFQMEVSHKIEVKIGIKRI